MRCSLHCELVAPKSSARDGCDSRAHVDVINVVSAVAVTQILPVAGQAANTSQHITTHHNISHNGFQQHLQ
jgi:hypothetical protein